MSTESAQYQRVKDLFFEALDLPAAERESFIDISAGQDQEIRAELRRLIEAHDSAETFLSDPAVSFGLLSPDEGQQRFQSGRVLAGRFKILRFIASGGMGEVYEAEDLELRVRVALKTIRTGITGDEKALELFKHEIQLARRVTHPNVCRIFDLERHAEAGQEGAELPVHFLTMELLEGQPLSQHLKEHGPFGAAEALPLIDQMATALQAAHDAGVIHRDFKPGNVILVPRGPAGDLRAVVTDFGLALPSAAGRDSGDELKEQRGGTPGYMPPEQLRGGGITFATDVYSYGVVVSEMVGGHRHEEKRSRLSTLLAASESHAAVSLHLPDSCAGWREILQRCVNRIPERRFQKPIEVVEALKVTDPRRAPSKWLRWLVPRARRAGSDARRPSLLQRVVWPVLSVTLGAAIVSIVINLWWPSVPPPSVVATAQLTSDGRVKDSRLFTDGSRIYFSEYIAGRQVAVAVSEKGGEPEEISTPFQNTSVQDVSQRGDELLVTEWEQKRGDDPLWVVSTTGGVPRRVGELTVKEARWSPDGDRLLYIKGNDVYLAKSDGTGSRKLISVPSSPYFPSWSPDGKRLSISAADEQTGRPGLWELNADGSNLHPRLAGLGGQQFDCSGRWTPDGKYFLFDSYREQPDSIWAVREQGRWFERWSRDPVRLSSGPMSCGKPVPSRDGRRVFVLCDTGYRGVLSRYSAGTREWSPFPAGISAEHVDFSKDGRWLVYTSVPGGSLVRSRTDGRQRLQLTSPPMQVACPRWSPDGKRITFMGQLPDGPWKIYIVPADGGTLQPLLPGRYSEWYPGWLPDGNSLVFRRDVAPEEESSKPPLVCIVDLRTNRITPISGSSTAECPRLSPDARYLAVSCVSNVLLFDFWTQQWANLAKDGIFYLPSWSHDSQFVYFIDWKPQPGVYDRVGIRDRKRERIATLDQNIPAGTLGGSWVGLAPDEAPLAPVYDGSAEVFALDWSAP